jgi:hypothetical protein
MEVAPFAPPAPNSYRFWMGDIASTACHFKHPVFLNPMDWWSLNASRQSGQSLPMAADIKELKP